MRKWFKRLTLSMAAVLALTSFTACSGTGSGTAEAKQAAGTPKKIVVWSHLMENSEVPVVRKLAEEWAKKTGNQVQVVFDQKQFQTYVMSANSNNGPDIMFGIPHNDIGVFVKAGLVAPVPDSVLDKSKYADVAIKAVTQNGKIYSVPLAMESMALFYNTDKVSNPPATYEEFIEQAKKVGFMYYLPDLYSSYAFFAANGAYLFKNNNGTYDPNDIGLGNEGSVKTLKMLNQFVNEYKFISADITGDIVNSNFQNNKVGFVLGGPWNVDGFKKSGVKFSVCPLPTMNGKTMPTLVGVQSAFVSSKSKNQEAAWDLMKYLAENSPMPLFKAGNRIPVLKSELEKPEIKDDKILNSFVKQAEVGDPIPNIPETNSVWDPVKNNITLVITGKSTPEKAAADMVQQIKSGIALQNKSK
jgi:arabinogalactan oligomer/maltooligosaccharide transport system substrate-binding protein